MTWRKGSRSSRSGCVEVAVRDSKNPDGPVLTFSLAAWRRCVVRER